ncbi:MAG: hypothetical protein QOJ12_1693, partial [Thermoleophilales bacterium]|nr:hypothetical protein [Thermoleophilales bacterium]
MLPKLLAFVFAFLALCASSAQATSTVTITGTVVTLTGTSGRDEPQVTYVGPADGFSPGYTEIRDDYGFISGPLPPGCTSESYTGFTGPGNFLKCQDGGHEADGVTLV